MAEIVREVASFDFDTTKATKQVNEYINRLNSLEKELNQYEKEGKDVAKVNKEIAQTTAQLNKTLSQESTTLRGTNAQLKATTTASQKLTKEQKKQLQTSQKLEKQTKSLGKAFTSNLRGVNRLKFGIGAAVGVFIASFDAIAAGAERVTAVFFPLIAATNAANDATREAASSFVEEKANLDALFAVAKDKTNTDEQRKEAINKLNTEYKEYLPNLISEKDSLDQLVIAQDAANAALIKGIADRATAEFAKKQITALIEGAVAEKELEDFGNTFSGKIINGITGGIGAGIQEGLDEANKQAAQAALGDEALDKFKDRVTEILKETANSGVDFTKATTVTADNIVKGSEDRTAKQAKAIEGSLAALKAQLSTINKLIEQGTKVGDIAALTKLTSQAKEVKLEIEEAEKTIKDLLNPPPPSGTLQALKNELAEINKELTTQTPLENQDKINDLLADRERLTKEILEGEKKLSGERKKLATEEIATISATDELRKKNLEEIRVATEKAEIENLQALQTIERERLAALTAEGVALEEREEINTTFNQKRVEQERAAQKAIIQLQLSQLAINRLIAKETGANVASIDKQVEELKLKLAELESASVKVEVDVDTDGATSKLEKAKEILANVTGAVEELGNQVLGFLAQQAQAQIGRLDEAVTRQKEVLNELTGNQSEANAAQVELERERLDKLEERRKKALERDTIIGQAQIALNAAIAISRAAAEGGGFASAIAIAATLASLAFGFAQARAQANQAFYDGTTNVQRGPGEKPGRDTVKAYLNEGEAVIPTSTNKKYKSSIEAIYGGKVDAGLMNDFVKFAQNNPISSLQDLAGFGSLPPSLVKVMGAEGISLNSMDMSGMEAKLGELGGLRREVKELRLELSSLPRTTYNFTERGLTKIVQRKSGEESKLRAKYR
jgi:hypothetical protein